MVKEAEFTKLEIQNNVAYQVHYKRDKHGQIIELGREVKNYKTPRPNKLNGRKSKRDNYTPSQGTISEYETKKAVHKDIKTYPKRDKEAFINGLIPYIGDLHDKKNENKEKVELIYNDRTRDNDNKETIETATTKEEKLKLANKAYDDFLADANTKKYSKTLDKHSVFSLPPNLDIPRHQQAKILQETIIKTIDEMEEFKDHKYLIAIHEDQINSKGGVHCHLVMAYHNGKGHSLHQADRTELLERNNKFKQKMVFNLYKDHNIKLENHKKPPFKSDLHKELTFLEVIGDSRVKVMDKLGEIRELRFKGCDEEVKKHNLQMGDRFDYVTEKTDEPKKDKDGNIIYIKGKKQYEINREFKNIVKQEQIREQVIEEQKQIQEQIIENLPENKLAREIEADEKKISKLDKLFNTPYKAKIEAKIKNKELALKAIKLNDAFKGITTNEIAIELYANNPFISSDERNKIIKEAPFINNIDNFRKNYSKIEQYLPNEVKENIKEYIIEPYNQMQEQIYRNPYLREERISKSNKKEKLQETIIEFCPEMTKYNKELKQLQEKQARSYQDIQRQWQYNNTEQSKSIENTKSNEIEQNTNTPTIPPSQKKKKMEKDREW